MQEVEITNEIEESEQIDIRDTQYYINRELSWLEFNYRVLEEAMDESHPLLERLKFLIIFSSNLDEFFMVRVASLLKQIEYNVPSEVVHDGMSATVQLKAIREKIIPMLRLQESILMQTVLPALKKEHIEIHQYVDLTFEERQQLYTHFCSDILPVLTPLAIDNGHPFPRLLNRIVNIVFILKDELNTSDEQRMAVLQLPTILSRFIKLDRPKGSHFVLLEEVIQANAHLLFPGLHIVVSHTFRVTRDADIEITEDEESDLMTEIVEQLRYRHWSKNIVRLEIPASMSRAIRSKIIDHLECEEPEVYELNRPLHLADFMDIVKLPYPSLKDEPLNSHSNQLIMNSSSIFDAIRKQDILVHHPFDSFTNSVVKFLTSAAKDPLVLAIKITLYRAGGKSPIIEALKIAAENGKEVTAFVELKARFDEENNIVWARQLEDKGVHVIYGILGLKTHCKIAAVIRKEPDKLRTYIHVSTGNYNLATSRIYTDVGYFTCKEEYMIDTINLFNMLTGYSNKKEWEHFSVAPVNMRKTILEKIENEIFEHTTNGNGFIYAKMNSLVDTEIIQALYRASQAGVTIRLLIRGICCLRPGLKGVSENIEVRSIIGRFLEHSRIFYFRNQGNDDFYISSADWMPRNLKRRVELFIPIYDKASKQSLKTMLSIYWSDTVKARKLLSNGTYERLQADKTSKFDSQEFFLQRNTATISATRSTKIKFDF
jgi:polyphosphate kinase